MLAAGEFWNGFPPGYATVMGCDLRQPVDYMRTFPTLAVSYLLFFYIYSHVIFDIPQAKLLNVHQEEEVTSLLKSYDVDTKHILQEVTKPGMAKSASQFLRDSK